MRRICAASVAGRAYTVCPLADQVEEVPADGFREVLIGRTANAPIRYDAYREDLVSRNHARIVRDPAYPNGFLRMDLDSRNGTIINRRRIYGASPLQHGDRVRLGPSGPEFSFELDPPPAARPTRPAEAPQSTLASTRGASEDTLWQFANTPSGLVTIPSDPVVSNEAALQSAPPYSCQAELDDSLAQEWHAGVEYGEMAPPKPAIPVLPTTSRFRDSCAKYGGWAGVAAMIAFPSAGALGNFLAGFVCVGGGAPSVLQLAHFLTRWAQSRCGPKACLKKRG